MTFAIKQAGDKATFETGVHGFTQEMIKLLKKNGFENISQNGSHVKMRNIQTGRTVIVPYHAKDLKKGLEKAILKEAGLK